MDKLISTEVTKNIKLIRETYDLPVSEFAWLLELKSKGSIYQMDQGISSPSFAVLERLILCFGISLDWLVGLSSIPYTEEAMVAAENCLINDFKLKLEQGKAVTWADVIDEKQIKIIPVEYADYKQRKKLYSLPVRSDIVLLLRNQWIKAFLKPNSSVKDKVLSVFPKALVGNQRDKKLQKFLENVKPLNELLRNRSAKPLYDLSK